MPPQHRLNNDPPTETHRRLYPKYAENRRGIFKNNLHIQKLKTKMMKAKQEQSTNRLLAVKKRRVLPATFFDKNYDSSDSEYGEEEFMGAPNEPDLVLAGTRTLRIVI